MRTQNPNADTITPALNNQGAQPGTLDAQLPILALKPLTPVNPAFDFRTICIAHENQGIRFTKKNMKHIIVCANEKVPLRQWGKSKTFDISFNFVWKQDNFHNPEERAEAEEIFRLAGLIVDGRCGELLQWYGYGCDGQTVVAEDEDLNQLFEEDIHLTKEGSEFLQGFVRYYKEALQERLNAEPKQTS